MENYISKLVNLGVKVYTSQNVYSGGKSTLILLPKGMKKFLSMSRVLQESASNFLDGLGLGYDPKTDEYKLVDVDTFKDDDPDGEDLPIYHSNDLLVLSDTKSYLYESGASDSDVSATYRDLVDASSEQVMHEVSVNNDKWVIMIRSLINKKEFYGFLVSNSQQADGLYDSVATTFNVNDADAYQSKQEAQDAFANFFDNADAEYTVPGLPKEHTKFTAVKVS